MHLRARLLPARCSSQIPFWNNWNGNWRSSGGKSWAATRWIYNDSWSAVAECRSGWSAWMTWPQLRQPATWSEPENNSHRHSAIQSKWWKSNQTKEVLKPNFRQYGQMKKQRWEESEKRREEERRSEKRKSQKKDDAGGRKGRKVAKQYTIPMFAAPEGRKVGSLKQRVRGHLGRWEMNDAKHISKSKCQKHLLVGALLEVDMLKSARCCDATEHQWKLRWWKSACRCGTKHISKSKRAKHTSFRALLEVEMLTKCSALWHESHFDVKSAKDWPSRATSGSYDVVVRCCAWQWQAQGVLAPCQKLCKILLGQVRLKLT